MSFDSLIILSASACPIRFLQASIPDLSVVESRIFDTEGQRMGAFIGVSLNAWILERISSISDVTIGVRFFDFAEQLTEILGRFLASKGFW